MTDRQNEFSEHIEYNEYTLGLALVDLAPVLLFLMSGLIMYSMYDSPLLLAGVLASFVGGLSKAIWKLIVVIGKKDYAGLTRVFHILMPAGFALMILSAFFGGKDALLGLWRSVTMMPAAILSAATFILMCFMGYLGSHMDNSARSNWIEELINTFAQLAFLIGVVAVYFGTFYHADALAVEALRGTENVRVSEISQMADGVGASKANGWCFDGPGTDDVLVFYPDAKVEATAYAPLMLEVSSRGIDCCLCDMPLNFALLGKSAAEDIRTADANDYQKWYIGGHSLGGVAAAMVADDAEKPGDKEKPGEDAWGGLVLLAAYPTEELSTPVLSIYGSEDTVLDIDRYKKTESDGLWPADFTETIIEGGNHTRFGSYGDQKGDGKAAISASDQQKETAEAIASWIELNDQEE